VGNEIDFRGVLSDRRHAGWFEYNEDSVQANDLTFYMKVGTAMSGLMILADLHWKRYFPIDGTDDTLIYRHPLFFYSRLLDAISGCYL
jgi:hypothetical protein